MRGIPEVYPLVIDEGIVAKMRALATMAAIMK